MIEIKNAVIENAYFDTERGLSAWLTLDYGGTGQGFGGYMLYLPKSWTHHKSGMQANYAGHSEWGRVLSKPQEHWAEKHRQKVAAGTADLSAVKS